MNAVDTSAFLEYFAGGPNAERFAAAIDDATQLIVPVLVVYEVFRKVSREHTPEKALEYISGLRRGRIVEVDTELAISAARFSAAHQLAMADAVIYATARQHDATLWTQDAHFKDLPGVRYFPKPTN
jgi:predicted nucleic acid-binding protein